METIHAIIGGSRGYRITERVRATEIGRVRTPFGESPPVYEISRGTYYLSRHGETGYNISAPFVNYRANIYALKELGVSRIIAWSGPGAIDPTLEIGELVVPNDLIDETRNRDYTFFDGLGWGFVRQNPVFCPELSDVLTRVVTRLQGKCRNEDVYVCTQGPRLETPAEIRKFAMYGSTLVGMTLVPEAFLARELEMCYCPLCYVTNYAEGVVDRPYKRGELFEGLSSEEESARRDSAVESLPGIALEALALLNNTPVCNCPTSMERYRRSGVIGENWREWIRPR